MVSELSSAEIVQDAMRQSLLKQIFANASFQSRTHQRTARELHFIEPALYAHNVTRGNCVIGSREVLLYLSAKHREIFQQLFLFSTWEGPLFWPSWAFHTYFVALDHAGMWFAGSPANVHKKHATIGEFYAAPTVKKLFEQMRKNPWRMKMPCAQIEGCVLTHQDFLPLPLLDFTPTSVEGMVKEMVYQKKAVRADIYSWNVRPHGNFLSFYLEQRVKT